MSYDMCIGEEGFNYTYNVGPMWYDAKPDLGIRSHYGLTGKEAIVPLLEIYTHMVENADRLREMEPDNGWGDFDGALTFVHSLILASLNNPDETWGGD